MLDIDSNLDQYVGLTVSVMSRTADPFKDFKGVVEGVDCLKYRLRVRDSKGNTQWVSPKQVTCDDSDVKAQFEYVCRRCGGRDTGTDSSVPSAWRHLQDATLNVRGGLGMVDTHRCPDGSMGVTDLVGYTLVRTI